MDKFTIFITSYFYRYLERKLNFKPALPNTYFGVELQSNSFLVECTDNQSFKKSIRYLQYYVDLAKINGYNQIKLFTSDKNPIIFEVKEMYDDTIAKSKEYLEYIYQGEKSRSLIHSETGVILVKSSVSLNKPEQRKKLIKSPSVTGLNGKRFWTIDEWEKRKSYLKKDKKLIGYEYDGYLAVEIMNPTPSTPPRLHKFCADFEIVNFCGEECIISTYSYA
jgi:hypothetical protein